MKQHWMKRILTGIAALALALPIAFGLGQQHQTHAADDTQTVILTKYGFATPPVDAERQTDQTPTDAQTDWAKEAQALSGVQFQVFDVTQTYWAHPSDKVPSVVGLSPIAADNGDTTWTTDDQGQITFTLPTKVTYQAGGQEVTHNAVYVFHELHSRTGYDAASKDFMLSLPAKADQDGKVYVYPKNKKHDTYKRYFHKIDGDTNKDLAGAQFQIQNAEGQYLQLTNVDGSVYAPKAGYIDTESLNLHFSWVKEQTSATKFVSDATGEFGLNGFADKTTKYTAVETKAPAGYEPANTEFTATETTDAIEIKDTPKHLLPHTGGAGILAIVAVGIALIALAAVGIFKRQARA
ncbi:pilin N-terminal domain-containing protein [Lacticaseibacillus sp. N501-2]|uniref:pilin N-terminal domain-containing protein n=1 Tax=Lacticaseibacillus salsurae TaxID=3367729 RepID=UPI0038B3491B